jgi:hypothetical protein
VSASTLPRTLDRAVLLAHSVSLALLWINFLTTARWADVEGAINGPKRPWFAVALAAATIALVRHLRRPAGPDLLPMSVVAARSLAGAGVLLLTAAFFTWLPPGTWKQIPFLDDWPIRYQSALDMMRLLDTGTFTGWEWRFLGGYHSSSDATQGLGTLTYLPMTILGPALGFHLAHLVLFALLPILIWRDLALDPHRDSRVTAVAVGAVCLTAAGYAYLLIRSGDTNSLGGVVMAMVTLLGAHAARLGRRWGTWCLIPGLALTAYAHPGFFGYTCIFLLIDAVVARSAASLLRAVVAGACGLVVSLPLAWEIWQYPDLFQFNNVIYTPPPFDPAALAKQLFYNVELLWLPSRWFNDFTGLALVLLPVTIAIAMVDRSRVRFYAVAAVCTVALMRLHNVHAGYVFIRPMHMLAVFMAPVVAVLIVTYSGSRWLRWSLVTVVALYVQVSWMQVPHVDSVRDFNGPLVDRVAAAPGALVLLENNPHRNMNADLGGQTERSRFGTHFEVLVAEETGRRLYSGGHSDGWQWNPWKGQVVAGGTFMGRGLPSTPHDVFVNELLRWGVSDLFVWSPTTIGYLEADPRFSVTWTDETWTHYRLADADLREVTTTSGRGALEGMHAHGAVVVLSDVSRGTPVVVRSNFHPAWSAEVDGSPIPLGASNGQLSFAAPCDGACRVTLHFPARRFLLPLAVLVLLGVTGLVASVDRRRLLRPRS